MNRFASNFILAITSLIVGTVAGYLLYMLVVVLLIMAMWTRLFRFDRYETLLGVFNKLNCFVFSLGVGVAVTIWVMYKRRCFLKKTELENA